VRGEVEDALGGWHARYLKKSDEEITPDVSATNFRIVCHHGSCRSGSWEESMGHVADVRQPTSHDDSVSYDGVDSEVKGQDWPLARCAGHRVGARPEAAQVPRRRHAGPRPPAGPPPEPVRPETAGETPQGPASTTRATKPDQKSWNFNESEQDFGEKKNPPKPHASP
jgi:hypothetical protein